MTVEEAFAKAEKRLSSFNYVYEVTTKPGIRKIYGEFSEWLSVILFYAKKAIKDQEERENPKRLTIDELKSINAPVWVSCFTLEGDPGYWCLCRKGIIICPSGQSFDAEEIPNWKFYLHKPKEG